MVRREGDAPGPAQASGFGEAAMPWGALVPGDPDHSVGPEAAPGELWGALKGSVHVAPDTDLTAPLAERWRAED
jgi:hypothetical protein